MPAILRFCWNRRIAGSAPFPTPFIQKKPRAETRGLSIIRLADEGVDGSPPTVLLMESRPMLQTSDQAHLDRV